MNKRNLYLYAAILILLLIYGLYFYQQYKDKLVQKKIMTQLTEEPTKFMEALSICEPFKGLQTDHFGRSIKGIENGNCVVEGFDITNNFQNGGKYMFVYSNYLCSLPLKIYSNRNINWSNLIVSEYCNLNKTIHYREGNEWVTEEVK